MNASSKGKREPLKDLHRPSIGGAARSSRPHELQQQSQGFSPSHAPIQVPSVKAGRFYKRHGRKEKRKLLENINAIEKPSPYAVLPAIGQQISSSSGGSSSDASTSSVVSDDDDDGLSGTGSSSSPSGRVMFHNSGSSSSGGRQSISIPPPLTGPEALLYEFENMGRRKGHHTATHRESPGSASGGRNSRASDSTTSSIMSRPSSRSSVASNTVNVFTKDEEHAMRRKLEKYQLSPEQIQGIHVAFQSNSLELNDLLTRTQFESILVHPNVLGLGFDLDKLLSALSLTGSRQFSYDDVLKVAAKTVGIKGKPGIHVQINRESLQELAEQSATMEMTLGKYFQKTINLGKEVEKFHDDAEEKLELLIPCPEPCYAPLEMRLFNNETTRGVDQEANNDHETLCMASLNVSGLTTERYDVTVPLTSWLAKSLSKDSLSDHNNTRDEQPSSNQKQISFASNRSSGSTSPSTSLGTANNMTLTMTLRRSFKEDVIAAREKNRRGGSARALEAFRARMQSGFLGPKGETPEHYWKKLDPRGLGMVSFQQVANLLSQNFPLLDDYETLQLSYISMRSTATVHQSGFPLQEIGSSPGPPSRSTWLSYDDFFPLLCHQYYIKQFWQVYKDIRYLSGRKPIKSSAYAARIRIDDCLEISNLCEVNLPEDEVARIFKAVQFGRKRKSLLFVDICHVLVDHLFTLSPSKQ